MNITLESINSQSVPVLVYVAIGITSVLIAVGSAMAYRAIVAENDRTAIGSVLSLFAPIIIGLGVMAVISVTDMEHRQDAVIDAVQEATGGSISLDPDADIPLSNNRSIDVTFTPKDETPRTCVLSTDVERYSLTCPTGPTTDLLN